MAHPRHRLLVMAAALAASTIATAAHEPGWAVDQIKREVERGRSAQVWPSCVELDRAAHPEADLWCGVAAVDVGRPGEGVLAIERYVLRNPDDVRGRLELARAYFYAGDDVSSRREFEAVRAIDPLTVEFELTEPSAVFEANLAMFPASIVSPTAVKQFGKRFGVSNRWQKGNPLVAICGQRASLVSRSC